MAHEFISPEYRIELTYDCLCAIHSYYDHHYGGANLKFFVGVMTPDFSSFENFKIWVEKKHTSTGDVVRKYSRRVNYSYSEVEDYRSCDLNVRAVMCTNSSVFDEAVKLFLVWKVTNC